MNNSGTMLQYILPAIAFILAYYIAKRGIPIILLISRNKKLMESPENPRKVHTDPTPSLGGVAIFAAVLITYAVLAIWLDTWVSYPLFVGAVIMLFFVGLKDDLLDFNANKKLLIQIMAPSLLVFGGGLYIESFGGLFGLNELPLWFAFPFTIYIFVVIINGYNLIDGLDGLAGGIGAIVSLFFGIWFIAVDLIPQAVLSLSLAGALIGFLRYNWQPASIFMGDTGSMIVGFMLATLTVNMIQAGMHTPSAPLHNVIPVYAMALLTVPLYDTIRVFIVRMLQRKSPFKSGTDHIHHLALKLSGAHRRASLYLFIANIVVIFFVILFSKLNINMLFLLTLLLCLIIFPTVGIKRRLLLKIGIISINPKINYREKNDEWQIKRVNGFSPIKLRFPQWQIPAYLNGQLIGDVIDNGEAAADEKIENSDK